MIVIALILKKEGQLDYCIRSFFDLHRTIIINLSSDEIDIPTWKKLKMGHFYFMKEIAR